MTNKQRTWGQFATPVDVADLLLGFCLRRADDRLLDPSCGDGALLRRAAAWQEWLSAGGRSPGVHGVELDPEAAAVAESVPGASIARANFLTLDPARYPPFDAIVGNPPYTRAEWIERLDAAAGQLSLFDGDKAAQPTRPLLSAELGAALDGRAGLYAYFFLHCLGFLREGGRLGFVVPNGWLDVAYGEGLKRFLLAHFRVVAVIEPAAERWFAAAGVNTCVVVLERAGPDARAANRVRFVRLSRPLRELLGPAQDARRVAAVEQLVTRLLPAADRTTDEYTVRVRPQATLDAAERWGTLLRAPDVYLRPPARPVAPLGAWAAVRRGQTTGANDFFYLDRRRIDEWNIAPEQRRPLLKSLRHVHNLRPTALDVEQELLWVAPGEPAASAARYLAWGEATGVASRPTCAGRRPWYALPPQPGGPLLLAKGVWQRHFAPLVEADVAVDQQVYRVAPAADVSPLLAAALLNSAWFALGCEWGGRVNLGEGVLWLASYELRAVSLPDPRALNDDERRALENAFLRLAEELVGDTDAALEQPARWELDELVFDALGLTADERGTARAALLECLAGRRRRAKKTETTDFTDYTD